MLLNCSRGRGGEFCVGRLTEKQEEYVFKNAENDDLGLDEFWEESEIMGNKPWHDFDDVARHNTTQCLANVMLWTEGGNGQESYKLGRDQILARFELDLCDDDRFEYFKDQNRIVLGWNRTGANFDKGFHTLKANDFSKENIDFFSRDGSPCLIGTQSLESGDFWNAEVPDDFDIDKLILIAVDFHIEDDEKISLITNAFYDGKALEINVGDTETRELKHFVMECNFDPDDEDSCEQVGFDYALEFMK